MNKHMFNRFLKAAGIDRSEMTTILFANSDGVRANARDNIEEKIKFNIEKDSTSFTQSVRIDVNGENKEFKTFQVQVAISWNLRKEVMGCAGT